MRRCVRVQHVCVFGDFDVGLEESTREELMLRGKR